MERQTEDFGGYDLDDNQGVLNTASPNRLLYEKAEDSLDASAFKPLASLNIREQSPIAVSVNSINNADVRLPDRSNQRSALASQSKSVQRNALLNNQAVNDTQSVSYGQSQFEEL